MEPFVFQLTDNFDLDVNIQSLQQSYNDALSWYDTDEDNTRMLKPKSKLWVDNNLRHFKRKELNYYKNAFDKYFWYYSFINGVAL